MFIDINLRLLLLALVAAGVGMTSPTVAQPTQAPHAQLGSQKLHAFDLENGSTQPIVSAQAKTTHGTVFDLTRDGALRPDHRQSFMIQTDECVDEVHLRFQDGSQVDRSALNDCGEPHLRTDGRVVTSHSSASPSATAGIGSAGEAPKQPGFQ